MIYEDFQQLALMTTSKRMTSVKLIITMMRDGLLEVVGGGPLQEIFRDPFDLDLFPVVIDIPAHRQADKFSLTICSRHDINTALLLFTHTTVNLSSD